MQAANGSQAYSFAPVTAKNHNKLVAAEWEALEHNQHTDGHQAEMQNLNLSCQRALHTVRTIIGKIAIQYI